MGGRGGETMDGLFFYWVSWMVWVVFVFFFPKNFVIRVSLILHVLTVITLSRYCLYFGYMGIGAAGIYSVVAVCICNRKLSLWRFMYLLICAFILALAYASFQLFSILDPVWVIVDFSWMVAILIHFLSLILFESLNTRISAIILGLFAGDCLVGSLLASHSLSYTIASFSYLDLVTMTMTISLGWAGIEQMRRIAWEFTQTKWVQKGRQV
jgi:hypothetical protein